MPFLSVVVPVYNSEQTLAELFGRVEKTADAQGWTFEIIFVEDCGKDDSWKVLKSLKEKHPEMITAIRLGHNSGQHNATMCGLNHAKGDLIVTLDDDLQLPPEEIVKLVRKREETGADLVYGIFENKRHSRFRNLGSALIMKVVKIAFQIPDPITSFRLFTRSLCDRVVRHDQTFVFIDGFLHWHTQYVATVLVDHQERKHGQTTYTFWKLLRLASNLLFNFTVLPLKSLIVLGLIFSLISFTAGIIFTIRKLFLNVPIGYTSIIVSVFFTGSVLLLVIGVIGEYLARLYVLENSKPQYSIKEKH